MPPRCPRSPSLCSIVRFQLPIWFFFFRDPSYIIKNMYIQQRDLTNANMIVNSVAVNWAFAVWPGAALVALGACPCVDLLSDLWRRACRGANSDLGVVHDHTAHSWCWPDLNPVSVAPEADSVDPRAAQSLFGSVITDWASNNGSRAATSNYMIMFE